MLNAVKTTVQEPSTYAQENREEIEGLKYRLAELNDTASNQAITIHQLDIEVDLKNRSLSQTLVFRNIKKQQSENVWDDTKVVLANKISKYIHNFSKEEIIKNIEQAHHVTTANRKPSATLALSFLVAEITNWDMMEKNKSAIIKTKQEGKSAVFALHEQYSCFCSFQDFRINYI